MSLTQKAMLTSLNIKLFGMEKIDYIATRSSNQHLGTSNSAGKYKKTLVSRYDISEVLKITDNARTYHRKNTAPWDKDYRLLPSARVMEYTNEMRDFKKKFEKAVKNIENKWDSIIYKQNQRLGPIFRPSEYPFVTTDKNEKNGYKVDPNPDLSNYYHWDHEMTTIPSKENLHLIIDLEKETIKEIEEQMEKKENEKVENVKSDIINRLIDPVKNMADICLNDKKVFPSLTKNIEKTVDILNDLNVTKDADIDKMLQEVSIQLTGFTSGQIRNDKRLKVDLGMKAKIISDKMGSYMGSNVQ